MPCKQNSDAETGEILRIYFRNKPERGLDFEKNFKKYVILCVETAFVHYNYMFLTKPYKILPFSKQQNYKTIKSYTSQMFDTCLDPDSSIPI